MRVVAVELRRRDLRTRLPFRYGIVTMTAVTHLFVRVTVEAGGTRGDGLAADHLPPRWFRKDASIPLDVETAELLEVISTAAQLAVGIPAAPTPFAWWQELARRFAPVAAARSWPGLLAGFGGSMIERAMLDAFCRLQGKPLAHLLRHEALGLDLGRLDASLAGSRLDDWLPARPLESILVRHTVGMVDPLTTADVDAPPSDGLPVALDEAIRGYGLRAFKLKLCGRLDEDLDRLRRIATVVTAGATDGFSFSLDANEQFAAPAQLLELGRRIEADAALRAFFEHLQFIEQPLARSVALAPTAGGVRAAWPWPVPIIIDESDGGWDDLPTALRLGYAGVSHKNCKGIFKGLRNACLVAQRKRDDPDGGPWCTTGEDLSNIGPVALPQDLAAQAFLGNESVERNGHHYFAGLSAFPSGWVAAVARAHPDLYTPHPVLGATLRVERGRTALGSVNAAPFGCGFPVPEPKELGEPAGAWKGK